jgi:hypothetical protein
VGPNFVFFSISIALAGPSAGGIIAVLRDRKGSRDARTRHSTCVALFSISTVVAIAFTFGAGTMLNRTVAAHHLTPSQLFDEAGGRSTAALT